MSTPEKNAQQIAANTQLITDLNQAINFLVSEFIRPNAQQHLQTLEQLGELKKVVEQIVSVQKVSAEQLAANTQQIAANAEAMTHFDVRLEATRQLIAQNSSDIAQMSTRHDAMFERLDQRLGNVALQIEALTEKQDANARQIEALTAKQDNNAKQIEALTAKQDNNARQIEALAELSRTQLTGIIGNGRRLDRLEQQAS